MYGEALQWAVWMVLTFIVSAIVLYTIEKVERKHNE